MRPSREAMAREAYHLRKKYGYTWQVIARRSKSKQHNVRKAAEEYAAMYDLEWPLEVYSKGRMIYDMIEEGMSLRAIRNEIGMQTFMARKYARDYARRKGRPWPVKKPCDGCDCDPCDCGWGT